jgi:hypothetical protein
MQTLRDDPTLRFEEMIDLCGVDYSSYGEGTWDGLRFAVVSHLLSIEHNWRVRVRVFAPDDDMPLVHRLPASGAAPTGSSAKRSTCSASCSKATATCAAS